MQHCPNGYHFFTENPTGKSLTSEPWWGTDSQSVYNAVIGIPEARSAMGCACSHCSHLVHDWKWWPAGEGVCPRFMHVSSPSAGARAPSSSPEWIRRRDLHRRENRRRRMEARASRTRMTKARPARATRARTATARPARATKATRTAWMARMARRWKR